MTATRSQIETLVMRIQTDYLDQPTLALTLPAAQTRFGLNEVTCAGVLGGLGARRGADPTRRRLQPVFSTSHRTTSRLKVENVGRPLPNPETQL